MLLLTARRKNAERLTWGWRKRGSNSPESLCKFASFAPVRAAVEAPPAPSRHHVSRHPRERSTEKVLGETTKRQDTREVVRF